LPWSARHGLVIIILFYLFNFSIDGNHSGTGHESSMTDWLF